MSLFRSPTLALAVAIIGVAALLGGSLGLATAGTRGPLYPGANFVAGPFSGDVSPDKFVECLTPTHWKAIYIWEGDQQSWRHYFNTAGNGVPSFVNQPDVGGMEVVPQFSGLVLLMHPDTPPGYEGFFPEHADEDCPS
jgi:hypothetical protein